MKKRIGWIFFVVFIVVAISAYGGEADNPEGKYSDNVGFSSIEFDGDRVVFDSLQDSKSGTFTMDGNTVNIVFNDGGKDKYIYDKKSETLDWFGEGMIIFSKDSEISKKDETETEQLSSAENADEDTYSANDNNESIVIEAKGAWTIDEYVDDFGDGIGIKYAKSIAEGTFSNSATNNSSLSVIVFFDPGLYEFSFRLLEYNKSMATYYDNDLLRLLFKFDDDIEEHLIQGDPPNGDLCLSANKEVDMAETIMDEFSEDPEQWLLKYKLDKNSLFQLMDVTINPEKSCGYYHLYDNLMAGNDARCVIYVGSSKYSFTIPADGFSDAIRVLYEDKYKEAEQLLSEKNMMKQ